jgi:hypothetical protein
MGPKNNKTTAEKHTTSAVPRNSMGPKNNKTTSEKPMPPTKAAGTLPKRKKDGATPFTKNKNLPTLTVHSFAEPLELEAYIYEQREGNDGYLRGAEEVLGGATTCDYFTDAQFHRVVNRRKPKSPVSEILTFSDPTKSKIWRKIIIRYPEGGTTSATRQQGLKIFKRFLMDDNFTKFPPRDIVTRDATDPQDVPSLDQFFLDVDIKRILQQELSPNILDCNFYDAYSDFAFKCWSGPTSFSFAASLGFPAN